LRAAQHRDVRAFGLWWTAASVFGMLIGGEWWPHYVVQLVPVLAWSVTTAYAAAFADARWVRPVFAGSIVSVTMLFVADLPFYMAEPKAISWRLSGSPALIYQDEIGEYVRANTDPSDTIQVAFLARVYYVSADRRAAVPICICTSTATLRQPHSKC
jgi:hypothetical protein